MTASLDLQELITAGRPMTERVLQNCRLAMAGRAAFGGEQIAELLREARLCPEDGTQLAATRSAAFVGTAPGGESLGLFADVHEDRFTRLWLMSDREPPAPPPPRVSVPVDLDLDQRGPRPIIRAGEHPELAARDAVRIAAAWEVARSRLSDEESRLTRVRAVVLRAFSSAPGWSALLRIVGGAGATQAGWYALLLAADAEPAAATFVQDVAGLKAALSQRWQPALRL
jgi:hypothetical protein